MNTSQINRVLKNDPVVSKVYLGTLSCDKVPVSKYTVPCALISNTDPSWKPGQHWIAMYIDVNRNGIYFDSFGRKPQDKNFLGFLAENCGKIWEYNDYPVQNPLLTTCGQFCIYVLMHLCRGYSLQSIITSFKGFEDNDEAVTNFVNEIFDMELEPLDSDFLVTQICTALVRG